MINKRFIVERTNENGTYTVVSGYDTFDEALEALKSIVSPLRHEIWCDEWVHTDFGYAPMAWKN